MNLLFIAPIFFDYEKAIKSELEKRFDKVVFRCEVPFNSSVKYYALRRFSPRFAQRALERYNRSLVALLDREKIDKVFVVRGFGLLPEFLEAVQSRGLELINYQWDSLQNNPNGLVLSQYTDKNFSFDLKDCLANSRFVHVPLFYTWQSVCQSELREMVQDIDVMFVGGYHSARHQIAARLEELCQQQGLVFHKHIYHPLGSFLRKKLTGEPIRWRDINCSKLGRQQYYDLLCRSRAVLDVQSPTQSGATMRTIEALSLGRKLISTNTMLEQELFYSPDDIKIWNAESSFDLHSLVCRPVGPVRANRVLSLNQWVGKLIDTNG